MSTAEAMATGTVPEVATPQPEAPLIPLDRLYRISVAQYDEMARLGFLQPEDRLELIEGVLVRKMTKNDRHVLTTWLIEKTLESALGTGWLVVTESPLVLARSEPEPDVMVLRGRIRDYEGRKPDRASVPLLVEVADSSYREDAARGQLYAEAGIPVYWIAHIPARRIECYTNPTGPGPSPCYASRIDYPEGETVPVVLDGVEVARIPVTDLLPRSH